MRQTTDAVLFVYDPAGQLMHEDCAVNGAYVPGLQETMPA